MLTGSGLSRLQEGIFHFLTSSSKHPLSGCFPNSFVWFLLFLSVLLEIHPLAVRNTPYSIIAFEYTLKNKSITVSPQQ